MKFKWVIVRREEYEKLKKDLNESKCNAEGTLQLAVFNAAGLKIKIKELQEENKKLKKALEESGKLSMYDE